MLIFHYYLMSSFIRRGLSAIDKGIDHLNSSLVVKIREGGGRHVRGLFGEYIPVDSSAKEAGGGACLHAAEREA